MDRRAAIGVLFMVGFARALSVHGQTTAGARRIGFFYYGSHRSAVETGRYEAFLQGMREHGYVIGKHFLMEARYADGDVARLPELAAELVRSSADVMVVTGGPALRAMQRATSAIPIVFTVTFDPVAEGLASSLARPGGNITGITSLAPDLFLKQVELLMAFIPGLRRVGILWKPDNPAHAQFLKSLIESAAKVHVQIVPVPAASPEEIASGFAGVRGELVQALVVLAETFYAQQSRQIASLARTFGLPSVFIERTYPESGGLASYGPSLIDNMHRAASYVDRILKGAKPSELPIEQPTRLYLVINRSTARVLGVTIPRELLLRADEVID